jgi:hypothetical protein
MSNTNVRVISAVQGGNQGHYETVNIASDTVPVATKTVAGDIPGAHQVKTQMTGATGAAAVGIPGTIPSVIAGATGLMATLLKNGLRTIIIPGYTGPA